MKFFKGGRSEPNSYPVPANVESALVEMHAIHGRYQDIPNAARLPRTRLLIAKPDPMSYCGCATSMAMGIWGNALY